MKRVESIIRPNRLDAVKEALVALGHNGLTVSEVKGHGIQKGVTQQWRGEEYVIDLLPKISVVAVVHDHEVKDVVESICAAARTDHIGDGKIFVTPVEEAIRIRTGEMGAEAL
jgi:nitrogen regulatory protein P-II 1